MLPNWRFKLFIHECLKFVSNACALCWLQFATEAAITILRIDDLIKLAPEEREDEEE